MTCPPTDDLSAYLDDALSPAESEQVSKHLLHCPLCQKQLQTFTGLQQALRALPTPALGFDLAANLHDRLHAHPHRPCPLACRRWLRRGEETTIPEPLYRKSLSLSHRSSKLPRPNKTRTG